jgi:K+-sensing histidine kinase KdpD
MIEIKSQLKGVADKEKWAARGASFMAKVKATKVVWFPPEPVETGKKAVSTATKTTKTATKKATRKTTGAAKKTTGAAKKMTNGAKKVTNPVRRKKT